VADKPGEPRLGRFANNPSDDVWIEASDRIIGGRVMGTAFVRQL
jgi:hypothetical protein